MSDNDKNLTGILDLNGLPIAIMGMKQGCKLFCWDRRIKASMHNDVDQFIDEIKATIETLTRRKWRELEKEVKARLGVSLYAGLYDAVDQYPNFDKANTVQLMIRGHYENELSLLRLLCVYPSPKIQCLSTSDLTLFANP